MTTSYRHAGDGRPLVGLTIDARFRQIAAARPEADAVVGLEPEVRLSYAAFDDLVESVARGLIALGFGPGDRVGIWSTDNVEWVALQMATARVGVVLVNINPAYRVLELEHALTRARVEGLFLIPSFRRSDYVAMIRELCPEVAGCDPDAFAGARVPDLRRLVVYDPADPAATARPDRAYRTWSEFLEGGRAIDSDAVVTLAAGLDPDDPINIQFTSGTTGFPKAVVLSHHNILNNALQVADRMRFTAADRLCVPVPFYHCFGMVLSNLVCLATGAAIVIPAPHFDAGATLRAIDRERCTALHGVPTMFLAELEHPDRPALDLTCLRTGIMAGAPCPPEVVRRVMDLLHLSEILIAYGQTEASPVTHMTRVDDPFVRRVETVGTNLPHQESKVVDPATGRTLAVGEPGEVCFRGYHVMAGYFEDPAATAGAIDAAGWLHSGDLGVVDGDGALRITGRLKDMILRGGENIYPAEIEALYHTHPEVAEVAVFGLPDERLGEEVAAWFRLVDGATVDADGLRRFGAERMAHFKVPRHLRIVDEFPMTVTGKIQKFRMREIEGGEDPTGRGS